MTKYTEREHSIQAQKEFRKPIKISVNLSIKNDIVQTYKKPTSCFNVYKKSIDNKKISTSESYNEKIENPHKRNKNNNKITPLLESIVLPTRSSLNNSKISNLNYQKKIISNSNLKPTSIIPEIYKVIATEVSNIDSYSKLETQKNENCQKKLIVANFIKREQNKSISTKNYKLHDNSKEKYYKDLKSIFNEIKNCLKSPLKRHSKKTILKINTKRKEIKIAKIDIPNDKLFCTLSSQKNIDKKVTII